jgi:hypothetical protein
MINAAAPEGTPPRRIRKENKNFENLPVPPCPGGALRRVVIIPFSGLSRKKMRKELITSRNA